MERVVVRLIRACNLLGYCRPVSERFWYASHCFMRSKCSVLGRRGYFLLSEGHNNGTCTVSVLLSKTTMNYYVPRGVSRTTYEILIDFYSVFQYQFKESK